MNKKICLLIILSIMFMEIKVDAANYNINLKTNSLEVEKNSLVDVYVNLNSISGITDGLNVCEFNLDYDTTKITINSISGENNWNVTQGEKIIVDTSNSVTTNTNIVKINAKVLDNNTITIKNINCTDGTNEYTTNSNTLCFSIKTDNSISNNDINNNLNNNSNDYNSSDNVENPKTGFKELTITFLLIALLSFIIKKVISKKDLFKKI